FAGCLRQHAVAEVEDVSRPSTCSREHCTCLGGCDSVRSDESGGLEVALDAEPTPDPQPGLVERQPPVDADDVAAGSRHELEEVRRVCAEVDGGRVEVAQR